jgi:hypothetical protein
MRGGGLGSVVSLVRQGLALEIGFGTHSVEALLWVAETVEEAVYAPGALVLADGVLSFRLTNPPLRVGAFSALRLAVDGRPAAPTQLRFRPGPGSPWRIAASLSRQAPLELVPGRATEFAVDGVGEIPSRRATLRLEFESVAIPPLVWVEFTDEVRREPRA